MMTIKNNNSSNINNNNDNSDINNKYNNSANGCYQYNNSTNTVFVEAIHYNCQSNYHKHYGSKNVSVNGSDVNGYHSINKT